MIVLAGMLVLAGALMNLIGCVRFLVAANRVGRGWLVVCLFTVGWPFFLLMHFSKAWKPFGVWLLGLALVGLGAWIRWNLAEPK
jgi:hypothetical protein